MSEKTEELRHNRWYYLKWVFGQYRERLPMIGLLILLTVLSVVVSVSFPLLFRQIIDALVGNLKLFNDGKLSLEVVFAERNRLLLALLALGVAGIFTGLYPFLRGRLNLLFEMSFREKFFGEILTKSHRFFLHFRTGDLVTRLTEDVKNFPPGLSWVCCSGIFRALNSSCIIFFCLLSMLLLNVKLTIIAILPLPAMLLLFMKLEKTVESRYRDLQKGVSQTNDFLESAWSGIKIVKSFNAEKPQIGLFEKLMQKRIGLEIDMVMVEGLFSVYFEFINYLGQLLVLLFGGIMVIRGEISIGVYYAFFTYLGMIVGPLVDIPVLLVNLAQSCVAIDRLEEMVEVDPASARPPAGTEKIAALETVDCRDLAFVFPKAKVAADKTGQAPGPSGALPSSGQSPATVGPLVGCTAVPEPPKPFAMSGISFSMRRGEKVAIVGKIGSGKTTLLNLVAGVLQPSSGEIAVNGRPLGALDPTEVRKRIGYIQQEPVVFSETVAVNIDFYRGAPRERLEACARTAQFAAEIEALPKKYDEKVGQRGITLSGGQRQRLSIARALVGEPELLLMDDVTSALDAANEQRLWQDLSKYGSNITCLIATHRLSSAQNADRILVLADGRLAATGTHQELLRSCAIYQELVREQGRAAETK